MSFKSHKSLGEISLSTLCFGIEAFFTSPGILMMLLISFSLVLSFLIMKLLDFTNSSPSLSPPGLKKIAFG